jgi:hypothetical protein
MARLLVELSPVLPLAILMMVELWLMAARP